MSAPNQNQNRNHHRKDRERDKLPYRSLKTWRDGHSGFVHSAPDSTLPTENLPINPDRNPFSLAKVKHLPSMEDGCVDAFCACQASDGQVATNPRNYSS